MPLKSSSSGYVGNVTVATNKTLKADADATISTGTATLTLSDGATDGGTQSAAWFKVGSIVMVQVGMYSKSTTAFNTGNQLRIKGLPFVSSGGSQCQLFCPGTVNNVLGIIDDATSVALLYKDNNAVDPAIFTLTSLGLAAGNPMTLFGVIVYNAAATS